MKKIIFCFIILLTLSFVFAQIKPEIYYKIKLDYDNGKINISSLEIEFAQEKIENLFGDYFVLVLDYDEEVLDSSFFDIPKEILWDGINPETGKIDRGGVMDLDQISFELFIPYYENAKKIIIYNENLTEIAKEDVNEYSKQRPTEKEDEIEDKEEIETKRKIYGDKTLSETLAEYWWTLLVVLLILIIVLVYSLRKNKTSLTNKKLNAS